MIRLKIRWSQPLLNLSIFLYFISIIVLAEIDNTATTALFYAAAFLCLICVITKRKANNLWFYLCLLTGIISGLVNIIYIGNLNFIRLLVLVIAFIIARLLLCQEIKASILLRVYALFSAFVFVMIVIKGLGNPIFEYVSNNYVSVYLLAPLVIYYTKTECEGKEIRLWPAIIYWVLCAMASSRMGLLTASLLLALLVIYRERRKYGKIGGGMIVFVIILLAVPIALLVLPYVARKHNDLYIVNRFLEMGMTSSARDRMWGEYLELLGNEKYLLFGAPTELVYWSNRFYEGDLHNSFLIVHSNLGITCFIGMIVLLVRSYLFGIKYKRTVYSIAMSAFCIRAFTDHVFGCNRLSPIILFFLLFPMFARHDMNKKRSRIIGKEHCQYRIK